MLRKAMEMAHKALGRLLQINQDVKDAGSYDERLVTLVKTLTHNEFTDKPIGSSYACLYVKGIDPKILEEAAHDYGFKVIQDAYAFKLVTLGTAIEPIDISTCYYLALELFHQAPSSHMFLCLKLPSFEYEPIILSEPLTVSDHILERHGHFFKRRSYDASGLINNYQKFGKSKASEGENKLVPAVLMELFEARKITLRDVKAV